MVYTFTRADGLVPADIVHCALDHLSASQVLFESNPSHFDSAGYLAHIGIEMLLKGWLLEVNGSFQGVHSLCALYESLVDLEAAPHLDSRSAVLLKGLDSYENLRYPNLNAPTEVGDDDWAEIEQLGGHICRLMPPEIESALAEINSSDKHEPVRKAGRVLMRKRKDDT